MTFNTTIVSVAENSARLCQLSFGKKVLSTPTYFPAISGAKSRIPFDQLFVFLANSEFPRILISSYDFSKLDKKAKKIIVSSISSYSDKGNFLFLDSGGYESFWLRDLTWNFDLYKEAVLKIDSDFYTSYDYSPNTPDNVTDFKDAVLLINKSKDLSKNSQFIPVVHGESPKNVVNNLEKFLRLKENPNQMVAIPERDCGVLLSQRAKTVQALRRVLNESDEKIILHLLGCGHPVSMAVYSYCGADSFDSIDWMRIFINRDTLGIYSHSNSELVKCECVVCSKRGEDPYKKILLHNLVFYQDYVLKIQKMIKRNTLKDFLIQIVGLDFMKEIKN
jgi:queuine/archaeosine tRNA-ribosyltransferase